MISSICNAQRGWSSATSVSDLRVFNGISIHGEAVDLENLVTCANGSVSSNNFQLLTDLNGNVLYAETYAILMAAQLNGNRVELYRTGNCTGSQAIINGARLLN